MVFDCIIIGAGASGTVCAIKAAMNHKKVLLLEHKDRILKKLLVTGNGRCNFTNVNATYKNYTGNNTKDIVNVLTSYGPDKIIQFFENMGIYPYTETNGKTYPRSLQAASMVDSIRLKLEVLGVDTKLGYEVKSVKKRDGVFCINNEFFAKSLVLATGGYSYPNLGSDGSGYEISKKLGHKITELTPILVQLKTEKEYIKGLEGIKVDCIVSAVYKNEIVRQEKGELLFTTYGISGPTIFNLTYLLPKYKFKMEYVVDFVPEISKKDLLPYLYKRKNMLKDLETTEFLNGFLPKKLGMFLLKKSGLEKLNILIRDIEDESIERLATLLKGYRIKANDTMGFNNAQVTAGGVDTNDVDTTLESKKVENLYFTGEILDIYGECGGYNLQFAFATGLLVGDSI